MLAVKAEPVTVHHRIRVRSSQKTLAAPPVRVVFDCEHNAARTTRVAMTRRATLQDLEGRARALYAGSLPEKLRGAKVSITVNGYSLQGPMTLGEIHDTLQPEDGALRVYCSRVMTIERKTDF